MKKTARVLTLVLALAICFSCMAMNVFAEDDQAGQEGDQTQQCSCTEKTCNDNGTYSCPLCSVADMEWKLKNCPFYTSHPDMCICKEFCYGKNTLCKYCTENVGCGGKGPEGICLCSDTVCYMDSCSLCADKEWRLANCPEWQAYPPVPSSNKSSAPDVSGKYRTSMTKILATVSPVAVGTAIENNELVIDPVTNTVGNLYDSEGNLIPCTLSSDGHFIIIPTNDGYAYIPTGE